MKKQYEVAEMDILEFEILDVITTSPMTSEEIDTENNWDILQ